MKANPTGLEEKDVPVLKQYRLVFDILGVLSTFVFINYFYNAENHNIFLLLLSLFSVVTFARSRAHVNSLLKKLKSELNKDKAQ